jgi:hypothetical protein
LIEQDHRKVKQRYYPKNHHAEIAVARFTGQLSLIFRALPDVAPFEET